jgi:HSP20 family protein
MAPPVRRSSSPNQLSERRDPFRELDDLHTRGGNGAAWVPAVDIEETHEAWLLEAELPGMDKDDVDVELRDQELTIKGEIEQRERAGIIRRRTRRVGRFSNA